MFGLLQKIQYGIFSAFWHILVFLPAWVLSIVQALVEFIAVKLPLYLLFGGEEINFNSTVFIRYGSFALICVFIMIGILLYKFIQARKSDEAVLSFKDTLIRSLYAIFLMIGIPLIIWFINMVFSVFYLAIKQLLSGDGPSNLASYLLKSLTPKFCSSSGTEEWNKNLANFHAISFSNWKQMETSGILLIIEIFVSIVAILYVMVGVMIRVIKTTTYEFSYFLFLPFAISKAVGNEGMSLKKWWAKYLECVLSLLIILIALIVFGILISVIFEFTPKLLKDITQGFDYLPTQFVSPILSIGLIIGSALGVESGITRIMYFFELDAFAQGTKSIKLKKDKKDKDKEKSETKIENKQQGVSNSKNSLLDKNNQRTNSSKGMNSNPLNKQKDNANSDKVANKVAGPIKALLPALAAVKALAQKAKEKGA